MIEVADEGVLRVVTLARPDKANALTEGMLSALVAAVEGASQARTLILTGQGRVFSAGADLDAARAGLALSPLWERLSAAIAGLPALTIAALNGTVAGGALGMVLACDIRLGVPGMQMFYPVMRLGFLPQPSDPARLAALAWGLIDRIVDPGTLPDTARALAADALAADAAHVAAIKAMVPRA